jgi:hypothetical protein
MRVDTKERWLRLTGRQELPLSPATGSADPLEGFEFVIRLGSGDNDNSNGNDNGHKRAVAGVVVIPYDG